MAEVSGPQWCARFSTSTSLDDLLPDFADRVRAFLSRLHAAGAAVEVNATFRPPERAYLMHWCCMLGQGGQDPAARECLGSTSTGPMTATRRRPGLRRAG